MSIKLRNLVEENFKTIRKYLLQFKGGDVTLTKDDKTGIAKIALNNPEKRNAMSGTMMVELRDCVETLEQWKEGKALVLYGKGLNFCSGADLDFAREIGNPQGGLNMGTWMQDTLYRLQKLPLVSTCLVKGPCLGGGAEISVFCDFIVAADDVKYGFVQGKMGITTAWGGGTRLVQKIGSSKALDLLLTARILTAQECVDIGIANIVVPSEEALPRTTEWLSSRLLHHYSVTRALKDIASNTDSYAYEDALRLEKYIFAPFWGGEINQAALKKNIKHIK